MNVISALAQPLHFFLELLVIALWSSQVFSSILDTFHPEGLLFWCQIFLSFHTVHSQQEYWSELPFPPPVNQVLSELFTMTHPSWVALHCLAHSFIELCESFRHDKAVIHEEAVQPYILIKDVLEQGSPTSKI